jgi:hypothetical protein
MVISYNTLNYGLFAISQRDKIPHHEKIILKESEARIQI